MLVLRNRFNDNQSGVALITVMLIVVLLTAIVSRLSILNEIWLRQVDNSGAMAQAAQATRAAQVWVADILENDGNEFDGLTDDWAQPVVPIPIAWGQMFGWIEDMQSRYNVNNLVDENGKMIPLEKRRFEYLLMTLEVDPTIAEAVVDWIDPDGVVTGTSGAEDLYYLAQERPYMAANRPLIDERELLLIRGIDQTAWNRLAPFITALPEITKVNINTARPEVIAAAIYNPDTQAEVIDDARRWSELVMSDPLTSIEEIRELLSENTDANLEFLAVSSRYFRAHTQMLFGNIEHRMATLYQRNAGQARILQQNRSLF